MGEDDIVYEHDGEITAPSDSIEPDNTWSESGLNE